ncbi:multicopper oxidase domain-containing protein [Microbacterium hominis]|uniref:Multicopper oxidase domain-containing protein n=1 Tax=Microbacterium hominis TaxID=162426 RepID=A0A7D4PMB1_9MICO|nr:multicopper oxidase domain-containing protein [Microbacterium hominis]QKJ19370.1 multicopper oxidase domain-containing protein [Microbacterium hominis]
MSYRSSRKSFQIVVAAATVAVATLVIQSAVIPGPVASAAPSGPTDETTVPHYFGPWPNWANSPLTLSTAVVHIDGTGTDAAAVAQVDPVTGGIASIDVTAPGHDYLAGSTTVTVDGSTGASATATATVSTSGVVIGFTDVVAGSGYTSFDVQLSGGGGSGATAIGSGGVDVIAIEDGGSAYTMPTVDFDLPESPDGTVPRAHAEIDADGVVTAVVVDSPGSGYTSAPAVTIRNGTQFAPMNFPEGGGPATVTATLALSAVNVVDFGSGYTGTPDVTITDPSGTGTGADATAVTDIGAVTAITVDTAGDGYLDKGMRKFVDDLPLTCAPPACPAGPGAKFIPTAVPAEKDYAGVKADEYVIGLVQYRTMFSSDLPSGTLVRGYVQLETPDNAAVSQHVPLENELLDGTKVPILDDAGNPYLAVTAPQYLGPFIGATKDKPVRIVFRNLLPTDVDGDLFLPTDSSMMGSGMGPAAMTEPTNSSEVTDEVRNPMCTEASKADHCFKDNRATLHLHGGITPWISDGTPHQWITPANQNTPWPQGVSVQNVPDMTEADGSVTCAAADDGCSTFYYTNQQSARLMFYHDHSWGITRLNVYAGEAAGYTITDDTEKKLIVDGVIPGPEATIPLVIQDRTFVPGDRQLYDTKDADGNITRYGQDPTWDKTRWGREGDFWYHHVYMPAQNPGDPSGMSAYGRWMYGPWFWPPATGTTYGPIPNPYFDAGCALDDPSTWQYQTDPFCEPELIPGTPNISAGMEQFNDTPIVNGVAYPKVTLEAKPYRLSLLNAANDRFFNLQWYIADPTQGDGLTEVALDPAELAAAQTDPTVSPNPVDANNDAAGPDWVQFASEGGFLPKPAVIDGQQPTTWITDPTRFDVGNVDKHAMLLAPAERADAVVDFSKFAGKTLILYNDAPAAFPARVPQYDYYTGAPDLSPAGAPAILPSYGPNTRTVMQVTIAGPAAPAYDVAKLTSAFAHKANGTGVFEAGQNPIIVGQAAYNSAYGTSFAASSDCNAPGSARTECDGVVRINNTGSFSFNTLADPTSKMTMDMQPKAIHDEMNASTFDEFGRMTANLGVEAQPPSPGQQNVTLYPYVNPPTELIDATNLPVAAVNLGTDGLPAGDIQVTPISSAADGTQIWRFTHNGVDSHPIHFHLYDVQVLNRVAWDNAVSPTEPNELGWKDTVRMNPLQDTIVALRPIIPDVPFEVPNAVRPLNPMMPLGATLGFNNLDAQGNPTTPITNELINFGWEYVFHCHILSHEEMDMMRPESVALPPVTPELLTASLPATGRKLVTVTWNDNSITETAFLVQRSTTGASWTTVGTIPSPLDQANGKGQRSFTDESSNGNTAYLYRVVAENKVGYGGEFPSLTVTSVSNTRSVSAPATVPAAPTSLTATAQPGPAVSLTWRDNATNESGFEVQRSSDNGATFSQVGVAPARTSTGSVTFVDTTPAGSTSYVYRVRAVNVTGASAFSNTSATVSIGALAPAPAIRSAVATRQGRNEQVTVSWSNVTGETGYRIQWSATSDFATVEGSGTTAVDVLTFRTGNLARQAWYFRVGSVNSVGTSWSTPTLVPAA